MNKLKQIKKLLLSKPTILLYKNNKVRLGWQIKKY